MNLLWPMEPPVAEQRCLEYQHTKLGSWTYFGWWNPSVAEQRWLECQHTKLGSWTYFGPWTPWVTEQRCLKYQYTKLGRWTYFGQWTPHWYKNRDALNTSRQNLADEHTLADGPPAGTRAEIPWIPIHKTWQMNVLWPNCNFSLLLTSSGQEWQFHTLLLTSSGQEWEFNTTTDI